MFCNHCGSQIPDNATMCPNCGAPTTNPSPQLAYSTPESAYRQPNAYANQDYNGFPMKWYKFLIYFLLFASGILNIISGIMAMTGAQHGGLASMVYAVFGALKPIDVIFGLCAIGLGIYAIYVRFELAKLKRGAPKKLMMIYVFNCVINLVYAIAAIIIISSNPYSGNAATSISPSIIGTIIGAVVMIIVNKVYFDKRASLFVN